MNTVIIHGQSHQGSTYHAATILAEKLGGQTRHFMLPTDFGHFCSGCCACFTRSEELCPHHADLAPIVEAMDQADVIILASPVYVMRATGPMKSFLDHLGYRFIAHRPDGAMFSKQGVCVSTTAGAGTGSAMKDMAASLFWWGVGRIYKAGFAVRAVRWSEVSAAKKAQIEKKMARLAAKILRRAGHVRPGVKTQLAFFASRLLRRLFPDDADHEYWHAQGWLGRERPWHTGPAR